MEINDAQLKELHGYTAHLRSLISGEAFACLLKDMEYLLAPMKRSWVPDAEVDVGSLPDLGSGIDWAEVRVGDVACQWAVQIQGSTAEELEKELDDTIIQEGLEEFSPRYALVSCSILKHNEVSLIISLNALQS